MAACGGYPIEDPFTDPTQDDQNGGTDGANDEGDSSSGGGSSTDDGSSANNNSSNDDDDDDDDDENDSASDDSGNNDDTDSGNADNGDNSDSNTDDNTDDNDDSQDNNSDDGDNNSNDNTDDDDEVNEGLSCNYTTPEGMLYYVDDEGSDSQGNGSEGSPWATIGYALDNANDGSTILVQPGTYYGRIRMRGTFNEGITVRSAQLYQAKLRNNSAVMTFYQSSLGVKGITVEGFDIAHSGSDASPLVIHIDGDGTNAVSDITLRNNLLHDSYSNDILKINHSVTNILVEKNVFYNQEGPDEHIDINSVDNVTIQDNIFFNDFAASGRTNNNDTSSFIVIKDSGGNLDMFEGSRNVKIRRNIFLNWQGNTGSGFLLIGEDGKPFYEAFDIMVENNLMLGNSNNNIRSPFGIKGGRDITFRNNTIVGNLPGSAFATRINTEDQNPTNKNIFFYNNIWSDPYGSMGASSGGSNLDFSDTNPNQIDDFDIDNNIYWNNNNALPNNSDDAINPNIDQHMITGNPLLSSQDGLVTPVWNSQSNQFADGSSSGCEVFHKLVQQYGTPAANSSALDAANASNAPNHDILGNPRGTLSDVGAVEVE